MRGTAPTCEPVRDRADLRRQRIIEAARILFIENGFHATGVAQIAKVSGVAVGQIYRDFEAKEDIVAVIVEANCATFMARASLHKAISGGDATAVWAWIRQSIQPTENTGIEPLMAEIMAESARNARIAAIFAQTREDVSDNMRDALTLLAPGDDAADRRALLADLVLTQSLGLMQYRLLHPELDCERLAEMMLSVIAREVEVIRAASDRAVTA